MQKKSNAAKKELNGLISLLILSNHASPHLPNPNDKMTKKFRALTKEGNMIEVKSIQFMEDGSCIVNNEFPIEEGKLLQYIGVEDKSNKEVYEGDLVTCLAAPAGSNKNYYKMKGKIQKDRHGWTIAVFHKNDWWAYGKMDWTTLEIIGNIFQNPELLK